jgi:replicative DNA helicase
VNRLAKYDISSNQVKICLSGNKGFHLAIHTTHSFTPKEARSLAIKVAGDLTSFDSSIYNDNRIIRIEGSVHGATGLRKTPISFEELRDLEIAEIKDLAKDEYDYEKPPKVTLSEGFLKLSETPEEVKKESTTVTDGVDYLSNPYKLQPWKLAISQGFFPDGQRSNALMILGSTLKNKEMLKEQCYYALKAAADLQSERYGSEKFPKQEIYNQIVDQIYKPTWKNGSFSEDNFPTQLQSYFEELGVPRKKFSEVANAVTELDVAFSNFTNYAENIHKNTVKTGIKSLDKALPMRLGHLIGFIAPPSVGKTSWAITVMNNTSMSGMNSMFLSYDMYSNNVVQKLIQKHTRHSENEIYDAFIEKDSEKMKLYNEVLKDNYGNVSFVFKTGQSISDIKKTVEVEEEKKGEKIPLIVVDYLELVQTDKSDPTVGSAEAIQGLRELANEGRIVIVLLQPNKLSSKVNQPMMSYNAAKGSSAIAQACTAIMGCWREGMSPDTPEQDIYFSINILKNRNGPLASLDYGWDGKTQTISELDDAQKAMLGVFRDTKKDAEEDDGY